MSPSEVLLAAADLLGRAGWMQGGGDAYSDGPYCVSQAVFVAADRDWDRWSAAYQRLQDRAELPYPVTWNDEPNQTAENVIATLRLAAGSAS